eukprot:5980964-Amphidinium_carterae.1
MVGSAAMGSSGTLHVCARARVFYARLSWSQPERTVVKQLRVVRQHWKRPCAATATEGSPASSQNVHHVSSCADHWFIPQTLHSRRVHAVQADPRAPMMQRHVLCAEATSSDSLLSVSPGARSAADDELGQIRLLRGTCYFEASMATSSAAGVLGLFICDCAEGRQSHLAAVNFNCGICMFMSQTKSACARNQSPYVKAE